MELIKKVMKYVALTLIAAIVIVSCKKDDDPDPEPKVISNLDFEPKTSGDGTEVAVTPTAINATSYSVDFGTDATDDVKNIDKGGTASYDYPNETKDYTIKVTAKADGLDSVAKEKSVSITFAEETVLMNFEDSPTVAVEFSDNESEDLTATIEDATADTGSNYGKVGKIVYEESTGWKAVTLKPAKYVDLSKKSTITLDVYLAANTPAIPITLKMEGAKAGGNADAFTKIEVGVTTTATTTAGWQKLTFDFSEATKSGDGDGTTLVLEQYTTMVLFIGVTIADPNPDVAGTNVAGTYEIDNMLGAEWGDAVPDTDGDGIIDSIDKCKDTAGTEADGGCPPTTTGTDPMDDFEGNGNITWVADAAELNIKFANPSKTGINTSDYVLEYSDVGGQYANIRFDLSADHSAKFDLSTKNIFKVKVYVPTPSTAHTEPKKLVLKLQDGSKASPWEGQVEVAQEPYVYDQWQELTFDFSAQSASTDFSRVVVQFNGENNNEVVKAYIDDFTYGSN